MRQESTYSKTELRPHSATPVGLVRSHLKQMSDSMRKCLNHTRHKNEDTVSLLNGLDACANRTAMNQPDDTTDASNDKRMQNASLDILQ